MESLVEAVVLCLAGASFARLLVMPAARREMRGHPRVVATLGLLSLAGVALASRLILVWPHGLRVVAGTVLVSWAGLAWRSRTAMGRGRGLPPGSLGWRHSLNAIVDPQFYQREAERCGHVFKMAQFHRPVACIVGLETGRRLLRDHKAQLKPAPLPLSEAVPRGYLRYMTPADHARYAPLFRSAISEAALAHVEAFARQELRRTLDGLAEASVVAGAAGVDPKPALERAQGRVLLRLYFGGMLRAEDHVVVDQCSRDADIESTTGRASGRAVASLTRFVTLLEERSTTYDSSRDCSIWSELVRLEPASVKDRTVAGNLFLLLEASRASIGGLLLWIVQMLGDTPAWVAAARRAPEVLPVRDAAPDDPAARAVIETLRLAQSEYVYRELLAPLAIGPFTVPKGWLMRICVAESHRLDPPFAEPHRFNPDRHIGRRYTANELAPFGLDNHWCIGARMSLSLGRILAAELLETFDCATTADGPRVRENRHWSHWRPSPDFRVSVRRRVEAMA